MEINELLDAILGGSYDKDLDAIVNEAKVRKMTIAKRNVSKLAPGSMITFNDTIRPKYLAGLTATITKINNKTVMLECPEDAAYGRFSGSKRLRCPISLVGPGPAEREYERMRNEG